MKIRTRLQIVTAASAALVVIMAFLLYLSQHRLATASKVGYLVDEIVSSIFERSTLRTDFLRNNNLRAKNQWFLKQIQVNDLIKRIESQLNTEIDRGIISNFIKNNEESVVIFQQIVSNRENASKGLRQDALAKEIEIRLEGQLLLKTYDTVADTRQLQESSNKQITSILETTTWISFFFITSLAVLVIIITWSLSQIIGKGVEKLQQGAAAIGSGNLQHTISIQSKDEFAEVADALNMMSMKLVESRTSLEQEINERKLAAEKIDHLNKELKHALVLQQETNRELESFTYSVSHDLRAPLRHVVGFVEKLLKVEQGNLGEKSTHYLDVIASSARKMGTLIDDLLSFSRMGRTDMMRAKVNMELLAQDVVKEIRAGLPDDITMTWTIQPLPEIFGDKSMLRLVLVNLLSNAVKYSQYVSEPMIEIGCNESNTTEMVYFVKDNGVGFDMQYVDKLFGLFQRLHSSEEFEGTGVGLANVRRIINRHGGRVWAEGKLNEGATFYVALPNIHKEALDGH